MFIVSNSHTDTNYDSHICIIHSAKIKRHKNQVMLSPCSSEGGDGLHQKGLGGNNTKSTSKKQV